MKLWFNRGVHIGIQIVLLSSLLVSCASKNKDAEDQKPGERETTQLVARVQSRPGTKDFVLLEAYGKWTLDEGVILYSYGNDGRSATLVTSGEKLGQFVAADVKSGDVAVGDAVYHRTKGASEAPPAPVSQSTDTTSEKISAPPLNPMPIPAPEKIEPVPLPSY
ncbi:MAG: hypothetical protein ACOVRB_07500 [Akkermansiaceae bacterium]